MLGRVQASALFVVLAVGLAPQAARGDPALTYLESLKGSSERYKAPSELDGRYTVALYVNAAGSGPLASAHVGAPSRRHRGSVAARHVGRGALAQGQAG
jgi:hypothetical protein